MSDSKKEEFKLIKSELIFEGRVFNIVRDEVQHKSGYNTVREVVQHDGGAVIVALFEDRDVILIKQYRYPVNEEIYELPAGKLSPGEDPEHCAFRELEEETGLKAGKMEKLTAMMTTPGFCSEVLHIFLATDLQNGTQALEQGEETIEVFRLPLTRALSMCADGTIHDGKTVTGLALAAMKIGMWETGE
jgi:ADP-ribose diphosphatase